MVTHMIPKLIGFEIELGNHLHDDQKADESCSAADILCKAHNELFGQKAEGKNGCQTGLEEFGTHQFRFYPDHMHAEISSPLTANAKDLVIWQRRAKKLARCCKNYIEKKSKRLCVHFANTSRNGTAWAFHLNVLVSRQAFNKWRDKQWRPLLKYWVPYAVSCPVLFGTGKVSSENDRPAADFQLSQRADFIDEVVALETVQTKSLINERDAPLADPVCFARFHITSIFDFNCCEYASWLKFGTTQLMLALVEEGVVLPELRLEDPIKSLGIVSRDLELSAQLEMADSTKRSALDIQEELAFAANCAINSGVINEQIVPSARSIVNNWISTIFMLRKKAPILRRRLDWMVKKQALDQWRQRLGISWNDRRMTELDLRYAEIGGGWFETLEQNHLADRLEDFLPANDSNDMPSSSSRDMARSRILKKFGENIVAVGWDYLCVNTFKQSKKKVYKIHLVNPLDATEIYKAINKANTIRELLKYLPKNCFQITSCNALVRS